MGAERVTLGFGIIENTHQNLSQRFRYERLTYQFGKGVQGVRESFVVLAWVTRTALQRSHLEIVVPTLAVAGLCRQRWMPCRQRNLSTQTPHLAWAMRIETHGFQLLIAVVARLETGQSGTCVKVAATPVMRRVGTPAFGRTAILVLG
jgi:hypothetical protein